MRRLLSLTIALLLPTTALAAPPITEGSQALGTRLYASTQAYGKFILRVGAEEQTILCDGIPGISGVQTADTLENTAEGRPVASLRRLITHFHQDVPGLPLIIINQNLARESTGTLIGDNPGGADQLFPGTATFDQYILIKIGDVVVANREPLRITATGVTSWPPVGARFHLEKATHFYPLDELDDPESEPVAILDACAIEVVDVLTLPSPGTSTPQ